MKITVIKLKDINDKDMLYLRVETTKGTRHNVNIGEKTYAAIQKLIEEETENKHEKGETSTIKNK